MKKSLTVLFLSLSFILSLSAREKVLELTNSQTGDAKVFKHGSFLVFRMAGDSTVHAGFLKHIEDSTLVIYEPRCITRVLVSEFHVLAGSAREELLAGNVLGSLGDAFAVSGKGCLEAGSAAVLTGNYYLFLVGLPVLAGGVGLWASGHAFRFFSAPFARIMKPHPLNGYDSALIDRHQAKTTCPEKSSSNPDEIYGG